MKNLITLLFLLSFLSLISQTDTWTRTHGTAQITSGISCVDDAGNIYTIGTFDFTSDFSLTDEEYILTPQNAGQRDVYISKWDRAGDLIWVKQFGGYDAAIPRQIQYNNGGLDIIGTANIPTDFDPGAGVEIISPAPAARCAFLLRLNEDGEFQWVKRIGSNMSNSLVNDGEIAKNDNGDILVAGNTSNTLTYGEPGEFSISGNNYIFFFKINAENGEIIVGEKIDPTFSFEDGGFEIEYVSPDKIFLAVPYTGNYSFSTPNGSYSGSSPSFQIEDIMLLEINEEAEVQWAGDIGSPNDNPENYVNPYYFSLSHYDDYIYLSGQFSGLIDANAEHPENFPMLAEADQSLFYIKMNTEGQAINFAQFGNEQTFGIQMQFISNGDIFIYGSFEGETDLHPNVNLQDIYDSGNARGIFMMRLDENFIPIWTETVTASNDLERRNFLIDENNYLIMKVYRTNFTDLTIPIEGEDLIFDQFMGAIFTLKKELCTQKTGLLVEDGLCGDIEINGEVYTQSGQYFQELLTQNNCDSLLEISLNFSNTSVDIMETEGVLSTTIDINQGTIEWIDCNTNTVISSENTETFSPTYSSIYAAILSTENCTFMSDCIEVIISSVDDYTNNSEFSVYPSITESSFVVKLSEQKLKNSKLSMIDSKGSIIERFNISESASGKINVLLKPEVSAGLYFLILETSDGTISRKIIVL